MKKLSAANRDWVGIKLPMKFLRSGVWSRKFPRKFPDRFLTEFFGAAILVALASCLSLRGAQAVALQ